MDIELNFDEVPEELQEALREYLEGMDLTEEEYAQYVNNGTLNVNDLMSANNNFRIGFSDWYSKSSSLVNEMGPMDDFEAPDLEDDQIEADDFSQGEGMSPELIDTPEPEDPETAIDSSQEQSGPAPINPQSPRADQGIDASKQQDADYMAAQVAAALGASGLAAGATGETRQVDVGAVSAIAQNIGAYAGGIVGGLGRGIKDGLTNGFQKSQTAINESLSNLDGALSGKVNNVVDFDKWKDKAKAQTPEEVSRKLDRLKTMSLESDINGIQGAMRDAEASFAFKDIEVDGIKAGALVSNWHEGNDLVKELTMQKFRDSGIDMAEEFSYMQKATDSITDGLDDVVAKAKSMGWDQDMINGQIIDPVNEWYEEKEEDFEVMQKAIEMQKDDKELDPNKALELQEMTERLREMAKAIADKIKDLFSKDKPSRSHSMN